MHTLHTSWGLLGDQRKTCVNPFSCTTTWVLRLNLGLLGVATRAITTELPHSLFQLFYCVMNKATPHLGAGFCRNIHFYHPLSRTASWGNCMLTFLKKSFSNPFSSTINAQASWCPPALDRILPVACLQAGYLMAMKWYLLWLLERASLLFSKGILVTERGRTLGTGLLTEGNQAERPDFYFRN